MTERLTLLAAAALLSLVATPLVVRAGADAPRSEPVAVTAVTAESTVAAEAPAPACRSVRVVYAGYGAPACGR
ncbi:hypothetical protein [Methylobacterium aquaticum]|uniref:hypothetical protein n=1 Tax=Methylobacterium aquaticum TaxID=270351 RepID=UPI001933EE1A|nr:hypothetical protein [Methylobacterium aquaticum]QRE75538.1 hypothetical protein F1D61_19890 [Methylobacterium aquaticum]